MAGKTINPTRMELTRLKAKQKTALRGHKLLKDKRDGLMKQFMQEVRRTRQLRKRVEEGLAQANAAFTVASAVMSPEMLEQASAAVTEEAGAAITALEAQLQALVQAEAAREGAVPRHHRHRSRRCRRAAGRRA